MRLERVMDNEEIEVRAHYLATFGEIAPALQQLSTVVPEKSHLYVYEGVDGEILIHFTGLSPSRDKQLRTLLTGYAPPVDKFTSLVQTIRDAADELSELAEDNGLDDDFGADIRDIIDAVDDIEATISDLED